jgi:hypothetical protein
MKDIFLVELAGRWAPTFQIAGVEQCTQLTDIKPDIIEPDMNEERDSLSEIIQEIERTLR